MAPYVAPRAVPVVDERCPGVGEGPVVPQVEHAEVVTAGQQAAGDQQTEAVEQPAKVSASAR